MDFEAFAGGVDPEAGAVFGDGDVFDAIDIDGISAVNAFEEFSNMDVEVALGADPGAVVGDAPIVAPEGFGFGDGFAPVVMTFGGGEVLEFLHLAGNDFAGEGEGTVGFTGARVFEKEDLKRGGLFAGFICEAAGADFEGIGLRWIAGAIIDSGKGGEAGDTEN